MTRTAFITGSDRGLGQALCAGLLAQGWQVYAGQYMPEWPELSLLAGKYPEKLTLIPLDVSSLESAQSAAQQISHTTGKLDLLINNAGVISPTTSRPIREGLDYAEMHRLFDVNAAGPLRMVEACLPLMAEASWKRLCFISSESGSISRCRRDAWYDYCMSKAALNMGIKILFNYLRPEGFTFRVHHPGWVRSYMGGTKNMNATLEPEEAAGKALPIFLADRVDEDRLVMVDYEGVEWPW